MLIEPLRPYRLDPVKVLVWIGVPVLTWTLIGVLIWKWVKGF